ncbi:hypothetical protein GCM10017577_61300 [Pseudonocardia halophobica]|uniref:Uncharacterized protein n=1 Tax=Pseudonocardia halophobica TaxID=29401 RepID=A0A9W6NZK4_9PSEU|nr:hypothetical protein [Pseudonocardia halophobica]GLL14981.1 hypothetical protein GCM10017577_61300 [Pseudonocardia halophobica]
MDEEVLALARSGGRSRHAVAAVASADRPSWWQPHRPRIGNRSWRVLRLRRTRPAFTRAAW